MLWTKTLKGGCQTLLIVGIICSAIAGLGFMGIFSDLFGVVAVIIGLAIIAVGILVSYMFVAFTLTICEISENVYKLQNKECGSANNVISGNSPASNTRSNNIVGALFSSDNNSKKQNPHDSWVCRCGKRNPNEAEFCASCKRRKSSVV